MRNSFTNWLIIFLIVIIAAAISSCNSQIDNLPSGSSITPTEDCSRNFLSDAINPQLIGIKVHGDWGVIVNKNGYLGLLDFTRSPDKQFVGWFQVSIDNIQDVLVIDGFVYALTDHSKLITLDASNRCNLLTANELMLLDNPQSIRGDKDNIYLLGSPGDSPSKLKLLVFSRETASEPSLDQVIELEIEHVTNWAIHEEDIFIAASTDGEPSLYTISKMGDGFQVSRQMIPDTGGSLIDVYNNSIFMYSEADKLRYVDLQDDLKPVLLSSNLYLFINGFWVDEGFVIMSSKSCDANDCSLGIYLLQAEDGKEIRYTPLNEYDRIIDIAMNEDFIFVLTKNAVVKIDTRSGEIISSETIF